MKNWRNTVKKRGPGSEGWQAFLLPLSVFLLLITIWQLFVNLSGIEEWLLPGPIAIIEALWGNRDLMWYHSVQTLSETLVGLAIAVAVGVLIATVIESSELLRKSFYPLLVATQTVPIVAVAPLLFIWLSYGFTHKVFVVALVCFFPVTISLADGYRMVDRDMVRYMTSMGASPVQIFRMVKLPAALPSFFSGLRIAATYSVMGAVIGEMIGASRGLGIFLIRASQSYLTDRVFAIIVVITLLSLSIYAFVEILARVMMPWYHKQKDPA
ncbi:MAG: ABC transporter permease [Bacillaceae bacterium]|nr:ABC transporter permease [Bacillaceae bacterium]